MLRIYTCFFTFVIGFWTMGCHSQADYFSHTSTQRILPSVTSGKPDAEVLREFWEEGYAYVTKVIDGDTFWIDTGTEQVKVRFIGVDAPETRNSRWKKKGYFGAEAKEYVRERTEHKWVRLETDVQSHDRYQRQLAYVYLEDGTFLNADLVANGYAVVSTYPPNVRYVDDFIELQRTAREQHRGLWAFDAEVD